MPGPGLSLPPRRGRLLTRAAHIGDAIRRGLDAAWVRLTLALTLFPVAVWVILHQLREISPAQVLAAVAAVHLPAICGAILLTAASYACLTGTEAVTLKRLGHRVGAGMVTWIAVAAYAVSNTVGFSLASGGAVRLRGYGRLGLARGEIVRITLLVGVAVTVSGLVTAGLALAVSALIEGPVRVHVPLMAGAAVVLIAPAVFWFLPVGNPARLAAPGSETLSASRAGLIALAVAVGDWVLSGAALYVLLPQPALSGFAPFLGVFILGSLVSAASGVPGGLGVFEAVVISLSGLLAPPHETAAALLLYRLIYGLGPLLVVVILAGVRLLRAARPATGREP